VNTDPNLNRRKADPVERTLILIFALLLAAPVYWVGRSLYTALTTDEVVSSRSIGHFLSMSGPGGLRDRVVIETEVGAYPLRSAAAIAKGTLLIMEWRSSGQRYICDVRKTLCLKTDGPDFGPLVEGTKP
jgi:hypothetical protein